MVAAGDTGKKKMMMLKSSDGEEFKVKEAVTMESYEMALARIGFVGLTVMGWNLTINIAEKSFPITVYKEDQIE
ncbi:hypothetical protein ZWY2020_040168 [Hordeum vulgare]|nr:hypothetical protein ZWY2020_040168 [Hordeum vulgare]